MKYYFYNEHFLLSQWLKYIKSICLNNFNSTIDRVAFVAKKLNILKLSSFIITVSGTNGKGSTCAFLECIFLNAGYTVGRYSSPHLFNYYERLRINGKYITNPMVHITAFKKIESVRKKIQLSYFEFITLATLLILQENNLDIIILEVGLGGRLDATNIIKPNLVIITNIGLDHIDCLGSSRYLIGYEKSGIFRNNVAVFIGDNNIPYSIYQLANFFKVYLYRVQYEWYYIISKTGWCFNDNKGILDNLPLPKISCSSAAIAIAALRIFNFNVNKKNIIKSLNQVFLPGRFHIIHTKPLIILDAAHNSHGAQYLLQKLKTFIGNKKNIRIYGIFGILSKKNMKDIIFTLSNFVNYWYYTILKTDNSATRYDLKKNLPKSSIFCSSIQNAIYTLIQKIQKEDVILVFGSFLSVSEAIIAIRAIYFKL